LLVENEAFKVESFAVFKIRVKKSIDVFQSGLIPFKLHAANGSSQQKRKITLFCVESVSVHLACLFIPLNQSEAVPFANICDLFFGIDGNSSIEVLQRVLVFLQLEEKFSPVDIGFVIFWKTIDALFELNPESDTMC
jgi:hypothetical protein